jgi:hypothetical protein
VRPIMGEAGPSSPEHSPYIKETDASRAPALHQVLAEHDLMTRQRRRRVKLLRQMEGMDAKGGRKNATIAFIGSERSYHGAIDSDDIPALGDVLMSVGEVDTLNLILHTPGGDGNVAEKIIELCRAYCRRFRVFIPNRAKSAGTMIALGADEIVMGYCSELGPIDAQIPVVVAGIPRYISAQSFINAKHTLAREYQELKAKKQDPRAVLQQILTLDLPFIDHCEKLMEFGRDVARKNLESHMFSTLKGKAARQRAIDNVLNELSLTDRFMVHGRMIDANTAKTQLKLNVRILGKDDALWKVLWMYYIRADVLLSGRLAAAAKVIESRSEMLIRAAV